jgi:predicted dinucleotide-binding enzyme
MSKPVIGIIGAGKVGIVLAQLARNAGYQVYIAGSGSPSKIALTVSVLVPGAIAATAQDVASNADVIIAAIPLGKYTELPKTELAGKIVIDSMNYWWEVDGDRPDLTSKDTPSSEVVQRFLSESSVVKAFSHIGYHDLYDETLPAGSVNRKAVAVAGNTETAVKTVRAVVDNFGFDPVFIGTLQNSAALQPGGPVFGAHVDATSLKSLLHVV